MSYVTFNLPILVQHIPIGGQEVYYMKPLFCSYPVASDRRYDRALTKFQGEARRCLKGTVLDRDSLEELSWFRFNPTYEHKVFEYEFVAGKQFVRGKFTVVYFLLKGFCFVTLPGFNNYMFMASKNERGKYQVKEQARDVIQKLIRQEKKANGGAEIDVATLTSTKGEFTVVTRFTVQLKDGQFEFEKDHLDSFFYRIGQNQKFSGAVEIEKVGYDLNEMYPGELRRAYFRDELVDRVSSIIYQNENTPIVIVGEEGTGKRSVLNEIVYRYRQQNEQTKFERLERMWHIDPTRIIAGMSVVGMWQKRFESILRFVSNRKTKKGKGADKIVVDNAVAMLRIGKSAQNSMTLNDVLKPYLEKRLIQFIVLATPEEWKIIQEKDGRFADLFQVIRMQEPSVETAVKMVIEQRKLLEPEFGCQITTMAICQLFNIQRNYLKRKALPGSVMKLLRQLAIKHKFKLIDAEEVRKEFEELSGLHQEIFDETYLFDPEEVQKTIARNLVGQQEAVECLSNTIHLIKSKMNNPEKPFGSFLFIGPTGVGKTQAAKVLCSYLMGSEEHLLRFDMNEYIDEYAIHRLIGDDNNPEGHLTGRVRYKPFSIILFDEIEKAHPKIHDLLLQVLDDGRLTDSMGRTVDFTNTVIIMTSNVGARDAASSLGFTSSADAEAAIYRKAVERQFRPEFINRIDRIVIFNPLEIDHILNIARLQIKELLRRDGFVRRTTLLNISNEALEWVARRGFDARMGGRALKRQIERDLTTLSADQLISTYTNNPIIFEILLKDGRLCPKVTPLEFVKPLEGGWLPKIPAEKEGKRFYNKMLYELERFEGIISAIDFTEKGDVIDTGRIQHNEIEYYRFTNRLSEFKEHLKRRVLGFGHAIIETSNMLPMRLKRVKFASMIYRSDAGWDKAYREMQKDKFFQKEGMDELRDLYRYGQAHFDKMQSRFIDDYLDLRLLKLFGEGFQRNKVDKIVLQLSSCITNFGQQEIKFLLKRYEELLKSLEIEYLWEEDAHEISVQGHSAYDLFYAEMGIHLFYQPHQTPIPIRVNVIRVGETPPPLHTLKVIRVYDGDNSLTDLRTGFTNDVNITGKEFKLLLYGGLVTSTSVDESTS